MSGVRRGLTNLIAEPSPTPWGIARLEGADYLRAQRLVADMAPKPAQRTDGPCFGDVWMRVLIWHGGGTARLSRSRGSSPPTAESTRPPGHPERVARQALSCQSTSRGRPFLQQGFPTHLRRLGEYRRRPRRHEPLASAGALPSASHRSDPHLEGEVDPPSLRVSEGVGCRSTRSSRLTVASAGWFSP